jgi:hypothetical protein
MTLDEALALLCDVHVQEVDAPVDWQIEIAAVPRRPHQIRHYEEAWGIVRARVLASRHFATRVLQEHADLSVKLAALDRFVHGAGFSELPIAERLRLTSQSQAMHTYRDILEQRIAGFETQAAP